MRAWGRNLASANRGDWTRDGVIDALGAKSDGEVAAEIGVSRQAVSKMRSKLGIAPRPLARDRLPQEVLDLLGHQPDREIAVAHGLAVGLVRAARVARGIGRYTAPCGSRARYHAGCRCEACRAANAAARRHWLAQNPEGAARNRENTRQRILAKAPHPRGKVSWYVYGCRCEGCRRAWRRYSKKWRESRATANT